MDDNHKEFHHIAAVVGAGPAGLFAARELANQGTHVVVFNRDIKPGGLAEYGIYPFKYKMKEGLRNQFRDILNTTGIEYVGNLIVGEQGDLTLDDLRALGFEAILVTVGAQSTKWLGLPGENLVGVYHAKDLVYSYNSLPPFSEMDFQIGKRVAVIGVGNVMLDVAHWLLDVRRVDAVTAVARRGPAEVKFDKKELDAILPYLNVKQVNEEVERVAGQMLELGQDPEALPGLIQSLLQKSAGTSQPAQTLRRPGGSTTDLSQAIQETQALRSIKSQGSQLPPRLDRGENGLRLQFLASPVRILGDENGRVNRLEIEDTQLMQAGNGDTTARGTGVLHTLDVDTVIFAIGDRVDASLGLPADGNEFDKNPEPLFPVEGISYEAYDPRMGADVAGIFVAGWARKASTGLVGVARKDGVNGARAVLQYLAARDGRAQLPLDEIHQRLTQIGKPLVSHADLVCLEQVERERADALGVESFKFDNNFEMLNAMGLIQPQEK